METEPEFQVRLAKFKQVVEAEQRIWDKAALVERTILGPALLTRNKAIEAAETAFSKQEVTLAARRDRSKRIAQRKWRASAGPMAVAYAKYLEPYKKAHEVSKRQAEKALHKFERARETANRKFGAQEERAAYEATVATTKEEHLQAYQAAEERKAKALSTARETFARAEKAARQEYKRALDQTVIYKFPGPQPTQDRISPKSKFSLRDFMEAYGYEHESDMPADLVDQWERGLWDDDIAQRFKDLKAGKRLSNPVNGNYR